ncbi:hypothetical protein QQP08_010779 [Theobroma cacao]|nr:hypothetical protein QQP08_010779 [Theobroma cacao]
MQRAALSQEKKKKKLWALPGRVGSCYLQVLISSRHFCPEPMKEKDVTKPRVRDPEETLCLGSWTIPPNSKLNV